MLSLLKSVFLLFCFFWFIFLPVTWLPASLYVLLDKLILLSGVVVKLTIPGGKFNVIYGGLKKAALSHDKKNFITH